MQKLSLSDLQQQLDRSGRWPLVESIKSLDEKIELLLTVSKELNYFSGHFPDQPVLPGIVQIHWAGKFSQMLFQVAGFRSLSGVKFNNVVLPGSRLQLQLDYLHMKNKLEFVYYNEGKRISSGIFLFDNGIG
jgi:3-hydroxymyristoyl/3-hydroxydecanoyl-(acyl carrier protein) dehydratase